MKIKCRKILILLSFAILFAGAGYNGTLPDITRSFDDVRPKTDNIRPMLLNPEDIPTINTYKDKEYKAYYKDIKQIIETLNKIKQSIEDNDGIQYFNAKAKTLDFQVNYFTVKYKNSKYKSYASFKYIVNLNQQTQKVSKKWLERNRNIKYISNYESNGLRNRTSMELNVLLNQINEFTSVLDNANL